MKRLFDIVVSAILLTALAPLYCVLAGITLITMGRPIFFIQERPGLHSKIFKLIKFRTMKQVMDSSDQPLPDSMRLNPFGKFMRATSLDELAELWNVLRGDMSLVGPRPLLVQYLEFYDQEQARRHEVRPGITGWAQINGRNTLSWEDKFRLDVWYVDHQSFWLDLKIIVITIGQVLRAADINHPGSATMEKFKGSAK